MKPIPLRRNLRRALVTAASLGLAATVLALPRTATAVTAVPDPDRNSTSLTPWGWHTNVSPSTVTSFVNTGYRIVDLEVNSASPTFTVAYVKNSGTYARGWWWYYGLTSTQVSSYLSTNGARLIDIEPYSTSSGIRYAVVMVKNADAAYKAWAYYTNASLSTIVSYANANAMRVIDVDRIPGSSNFTAVMIKNTGVDAKGWWHYYNVTPAQIGGYLSTNKARLIDFERLDNGNYDVVMQTAGSEGWWWYYGKSQSEVSRLANQLGVRIYKIKSYLVSGVRKYDVLLIDDLDAESRRVRNAVYAKMTGNWGFYLKKIGSSELLTLGEDNVFEPASMIKIVHGVTAMREIQNTSVTPDSTFTWYVHPTYDARYPSDPDYRPGDGGTEDADVCPYNSDTGALITTRPYVDKLGPVLIKQMLVYSDNRATDFMARRYGFTALNNTIALAGMTDSKVNHRIGCPAKASPQPIQHNNLTLTDAGRIYEKIQNLTLLDATHRDLLYSYMGGGAVGTGSGALQDMVRQEATAAGLTSTEANTFLNNLVTRSKGGSYGYCPNFDGSGTCNPPTVYSRTVGGVIWIPFKSSGVIVKTPYTYGRYWNSQLSCTFASQKAGTCTAFNNNQTGMGTVGVEMFRAEVKKALATW